MRAFLVRFGVVAVVFAAQLMTATAVVDDARIGPKKAFFVAVVSALAVAAIAAVVERWKGVHRQGPDDRNWWQILGFEKQRQRLEERAFRNSVVAGVGYLLAAGAVFALYYGTGTLEGFSITMIGFLTYLGGLRIWLGVRRWRAGGEFNLPGAGPVLRIPPVEARRD